MDTLKILKVFQPWVFPSSKLGGWAINRSTFGSKCDQIWDVHLYHSFPIHTKHWQWESAEKKCKGCVWCSHRYDAKQCWWLKANIRSKTTAHRPQKKKLCNSQLAAEADKSSCGQRWHKKGKQLHPRWSDTQHAKAQRAQTWDFTFRHLR